MSKLNLEKEIDDIVALPPKPKTNFWLIATVSLGTVFIVGAISFALGFFGAFCISPLYTPTACTSQTTDLKIKGNKNSKIYHLPECQNYDDIAERNIVWFRTHEEAKAKGYRMAKNCP